MMMLQFTIIQRGGKISEPHQLQLQGEKCNPYLMSIVLYVRIFQSKGSNEMYSISPVPLYLMISCLLLMVDINPEFFIPGFEKNHKDNLRKNNKNCR